MKNPSKLQLAIGLSIGLSAGMLGLLGSKEKESTNIVGSGRVKISNVFKDTDNDDPDVRGKGDGIDLLRKAEKQRILWNIIRAASKIKTQKPLLKDQMISAVDSVFFPNGARQSHLLKNSNVFISDMGFKSYFLDNPRDIDDMGANATDLESKISDYDFVFEKYGMDGSEIVFGLDWNGGGRGLYIMTSNGDFYAYLGFDEYGPIMRQIESRDLEEDIKFRDNQ